MGNDDSDDLIKAVSGIKHENLESIADQMIAESSGQATRVLTAQEIKAYLDTMVVGQEDAKIQISVLLSMHMNWFTQENRMHRAPNAIVIGPTGVGKTHTLRIASEFLKIPFIAVDTTSLVPSGIAGYQIEDVLADLVREAADMLKRNGVQKPEKEDRDIELARRGIIFFDEFDKISTANLNPSTESSNLSVQRRLLKLTDGAVLGVGVRTHQGWGDSPRSIDTSGILVVSGGAFVGIDSNEIRTKRPQKLQRELANPNVIVSMDVVNYGFMPELVARLPVIIEYQPLTDADLLQILEIPDISPIQVWIEHFKKLGKELIITDDAKKYAVTRAQILKMGARGLHQVLFQSLAKIAFEVETSPQPVYRVTAEKLAQVSRSIGGRNGDNR